MTNEEIQRIKDELKNINEKPFAERGGPLQKIALRIGAHVPIQAPNSIIHLNRTILNVLQTEMMLNACISAEHSCGYAKQSCGYAKWSCFFAAVAALFACISSVITLTTLLSS